MADDIRKVCFIVMGFGRKTDFESGRTLDLDATYEAIIKPAAESQGYRCIRADEIMHSGIIDMPMYEMLLRANLVIADISTGNVNAVYELGVRHALRPYSTIIMKEQDGKLSFDLNHINTFHYQHLGDDIGSREAKRAKKVLSDLIKEIDSDAKPDSPVYTFLPRLQKPKLSDEEYAEILEEAEVSQERFSSLIEEGELALKESRPQDAVIPFTRALLTKKGDPYLIQRLALATYKSKNPSELEALISALSVINDLQPENSNDPETLGIAGAIRKRLWLITKDLVQLDLAIKLYGRGFEIKRDYYNGENLAQCYEYRSVEQNCPEESQYDKMSARKVRGSVVEIVLNIIDSESFEERSDRKWVHATLANCLYAVGKIDEAKEQEKKFLEFCPSSWEIETYNDGRDAVIAFHQSE